VTKEDTAEAVNAFCEKLRDELKARGFRVKLDDRDLRTPDKMWDAVKKGIPLRVEVGGREVENGELTHVRRDIGRDSKTTVKVEDFMGNVQNILDDIHDALLARQRQFRDDNTHDMKSVKEIDAFYDAGKIGFVRVDIDLLKDETLADVMTKHSLSTRNMPLTDAGQKVLLAKAY
jgi:prolyl-tRNA synthetase